MNKVCSKCLIEKPKDSFSISGSKIKFTNAWCKLCQAEYKRAWRKENAGKNKRYCKEYRLKNPLKSSEDSKFWRKLNPSRQAELTKQRADKFKLATPSWLTKAQREEMNYVYSLARELTSLHGESYHVDHIEPISGREVCGLHVPWNLQVLPGDLNIAKGNRRK